MSSIKVVVERHPDGYVAYPVGLKGVVVGEGDSYEQALADVTSAIRFHLETFGKEVLEDSEVLEAFLTETDVAVE
ncbi:MAG TPA: type II toxin-antitoxin system HicB family antitoxin [Thermoanaerobaculia bacterium]|jgi:predicted RNase H-like HicB family nuclease